jgi:hypothetical protein
MAANSSLPAIPTLLRLLLDTLKLELSAQPRPWNLRSLNKGCENCGKQVVLQPSHQTEIELI